MFSPNPAPSTAGSGYTRARTPQGGMSPTAPSALFPTAKTSEGLTGDGDRGCVTYHSRSYSPNAITASLARLARTTPSMISTTLLTTAAAGPQNFLAFGDSWAWLGFDQFKAALAPHGINASRHAIPGTPAGYWAWAQPQALVDAVDAANADAVYLSIGGNDFLEGLPAGHHVETLFEEMMASTRLVLTRLFEQRPHVHVFHFGYELLDWNSCGVCEAFGHEELHGSASRGMCPDTSNVTCMTYSQVGPSHRSPRPHLHPPPCPQPHSHDHPRMHCMQSRTRRSSCSVASLTRASRASSPATRTTTP